MQSLNEKLQLDAATVQFLDEVARARSLRLTEGKNYLNAYDYVKYLGINLKLESQFSWIAREMCRAPLPLNCEEFRSESNLIYFRDKELGVCTLEHPWTQRYLKMLEIQRLEFYATLKQDSVARLRRDTPTILFHLEYPHLQIPCEDCCARQSTKHCEYCLASFCDFCFATLHPSSSCHSYRATAAGSDCSVCARKKPNVYCKSCSDFFCFACFESIHKKGKRFEHVVMRISAGLQGTSVAVDVRCACGSVGCYYCEFCQTSFCLACFWTRHINGNRRTHTARHILLRPLCSECQTTRGSVFCDQCCELFCTTCFTRVHSRGNRKLHIFRDAMNLPLLLQRTSGPDLVNVFNAASRIQAWIRGCLQRKNFRKKRTLAVVIQKIWRGGETRRKLMGMMDQLNWRRRVVLNEVVHGPKTHSLAAKYHFASLYHDQVVAQLKSSQDDHTEDVKIEEPADHTDKEEVKVAEPPLVQSRLAAQVKQRSALGRLFRFLKTV